MADHRKSPYPFQLDAFQRLKYTNVILNAPTGSGKTLVAVLAVDYFLRVKPHQRVLFVVPTRPLVNQQAEYLRRESRLPSPPAVAELAGGRSMGAYDWKQCLERNAVLMCTAEVARRALVEAFVPASQLSLVILDECHHATGNSPYVSILRDVVNREPSHSRPRVLGLTASFVNGAIENLQSKREALEELLHANVFMPHSVGHTQNQEFILFAFEPAKVTDADKTKLQRRVEEMAISCGISVPLVNLHWAKEGAVFVFESLGLAGLVFYLSKLVVPQLQAHREGLEKVVLQQTEDFGYGEGSEGSGCLSAVLQQHIRAVEDDDALKEFHCFKLDRLFELLRCLREDIKVTSFRGIVFVERVLLTYPLAELINKEFAREKVTALPASGGGSMKDSVRLSHLDKFNKGEVQLLVSTNALEEGIDIRACSFIIRYDKFNTTRSHIQGSGRARAPNAVIYYFENDPVTEKARADALREVAQDPELALSEHEMEHRTAEYNATFHSEFHPRRHPESCACLDAINCLTLFYEYCQKVLGQSFKPEEELFAWGTQQVRAYPQEQSKKLRAIRYPSLEGWIIVTAATVAQCWEGRTLESVVDPTRLKKLKGKEKEMRMFAYVAMLQMADRGLLDSHFKASPVAVQMVKHMCSSRHMDSQAKFKNSYAGASVRVNPRTSPSASGASSEHTPGFGTAPSPSRPSQEWVCSGCQSRNTASLQSCAACSSTRPTSSFPMDAESPNANPGSRSEPKWSCSRCTLDNPAASRSCCACNTPRAASTASSSCRVTLDNSQAFGSTQKWVGSADMWSCPQCTLHNAGTNLFCQACNMPKPSSRSNLRFASPSSDSSPFAASKLKEPCGKPRSGLGTPSSAPTHACPTTGTFEELGQLNGGDRWGFPYSLERRSAGPAARQVEPHPMCRDKQSEPSLRNVGPSLLPSRLPSTDNNPHSASQLWQCIVCSRLNRNRADCSLCGCLKPEVPRFPSGFLLGAIAQKTA
eukprot:RCo005099